MPGLNSVQSLLLVNAVVVFLVLQAPGGAQASVLVKDQTNPGCIAHSNASTFDISKLFAWPVMVNGTGADGKSYTFIWSCKGDIPCDYMDNGDANTVSICQVDKQLGHHFPVGGKPADSMWFANYNWGENDKEYSIMYQVVGDIRISRVKFVVDEKVATPKIEMLGEAPYTEYSFVVTGKQVGQPEY
jgi:hypothetical protein